MSATEYSKNLAKVFHSLADLVCTKLYETAMVAETSGMSFTSEIPPYRGSDHVGPDDGGKEGVLGGTRRVLAVPGHAHGGRAAVREAEAVLRVPVSAAVG